MTPLRQGYAGQGESGRIALDVSPLPAFGFGNRSVLWWATTGMMLIEGSVFALVVVQYLYLKGRVPHWPPSGPPPDLLWGTINTLILLASCLPNALTKKAAERFDLRGVRIWLGVCVLSAVGFNVVRFLEFGRLNVRWDSNAYGSVVWLLIASHTVHVVTDFLDTLVLWVLILAGIDINERRYVDVSENALYWYFVVFTWLPIYAVVYFGPRVS
jgi:heme/copper-type cytochrome/quinol oxidase subunit 3